MHLNLAQKLTVLSNSQLDDFPSHKHHPKYSVICVPFYYDNHWAIKWLSLFPQHTSNEATLTLCVSRQHFKRPVMWSYFVGGISKACPLRLKHSSEILNGEN